MSTLTKKVIQDQGIEINVNQKDIIDVIVSEKIQSMHDEVNALYLQYKELDAYVSDIITQNGLKHKDYLFSPKDKCDIKSHTDSDYKILKKIQIHFPEIIEIYNGRGKEEVNICKVNTPTSVEYKITHSKKIGDKIYTCEKVAHDESFVLPQELITLITKHNKKVKLLKEKYPEPFNVASIEKQMKNHFTKEILKSTTSEFKQLLKSNFNLTL